MDTSKKSIWSRVKPWLIILSALPVWILIFAILQFLIGGLLAEINGKNFMDFQELSRIIPDSVKMISFSLQLISLFLVTWIYWVKILKYPFITIGFEWTKSTRNELLLGFITGVFLLGLIFAILFATKKIEITNIQFSLKHFLIHSFVYLIIAFSEELLFRGYLLGATMKLANKYVVLFIFAFLFSLAHAFNANFEIIPALNIFLAGIILGIYFIHTQRLWFSISLHFTWNFLQGPVFGSHVSGGTDEHTIITHTIFGEKWLTGGNFGFEGSLIMTVLLIVLITGIEIYFRKKNNA